MRSAAITNGSESPPTTSEPRITVKVTNTIRSRSGKPPPARIVSGSASAAASETAPRRPENVTTSRCFHCPCVSSAVPSARASAAWP